jgi:hypothetical protein
LVASSSKPSSIRLGRFFLSRHLPQCLLAFALAQPVFASVCLAGGDESKINGSASLVRLGVRSTERKLITFARKPGCPGMEVVVDSSAVNDSSSVALQLLSIASNRKAQLIVTHLAPDEKIRFVHLKDDSVLPMEHFLGDAFWGFYFPPRPGDFPDGFYSNDAVARIYWVRKQTPNRVTNCLDGVKTIYHELKHHVLWLTGECYLHEIDKNGIVNKNGEVNVAVRNLEAHIVGNSDTRETSNFGPNCEIPPPAAN